MASIGGTAIEIDKLDRELLNRLQGSFPLDPHPFERIAEMIDLSEGEVIDRTRRLKDGRIIRELGPIFDTRSLGYQSMLVAAKVERERRRQAAAIINEHPGVSHNYERNHDFNLWFTIAVDPATKLGLDRTLEILQRRAGLDSYRKLPTLKLFKINMNLEMASGPDALKRKIEAPKARELTVKELSSDDVAVVRELQGDLPLVERPFDGVAERLGWGTERLIGHCGDMVERGILRRVAAILYHRRAGYAANGMGVWNVPSERVAELGPVMASFRGVSHCYQRPTYPDWPYSIFTMAHGHDRQQCDDVLASISQETGIDDYQVLYSASEYKKVRLKYFSPQFEQWEQQNG